MDNSEKDRVSFEVNGDVLAGFTASELQGKNILLSFQPASVADQAIYDSYNSIFDVPAYAVYMKPVLPIDNEVVAKGESYLESTLGTKGSFTINLTSGGRNTSVTNDVTTGSMYAVTLDSQNITAEELQSVYDEAAALKDSVTEDNVYSEEYLGKLLSLAEKLYFAQVDIADTLAADMYDVAVTRSLSEGITGYESVSTISILAKAQEQNIDILLISSINLGTEIEKLNTDEATRQSVINAVNSGMIVTIPAEEIAIGAWHGTGYIVTNPATGAGEYIISGGLNGGALAVVVTIAVLCAAIILLYLMVPVIEAIVGLVIALFSGILTITGIVVVLAKLAFWGITLIGIFSQWCNMFEAYNQYLQTGDLDAAESAAKQAKKIGCWGLAVGIMQMINSKIANGLESAEAGEGLVKEGLGKISGKTFKVTQQGIENIKKYLTSMGFIEDYENIEMIKRLEAALKNGGTITGADAVYYTHELYEAQLVSEGVAQEVAHKLALEFYEVSPYSVYHPDVIQMDLKQWGDPWLEFWGLERGGM